MTSTHADTAFTDLTATLEVDAQGYTGQPFTMTGTIRNAALTPADGATITFTAGASTNVAVSCTASGGAVCPDEFTVSGSTATGVVPTFPGYGTLTLTITGKYPGGSSVDAILDVQPPVGVTDTDTVSNMVTQNVGLVTPNTTIKVTKTQDKLVVMSGETRTYTVTYENTGDFDSYLRLSDYNVAGKERFWKVTNSEAGFSQPILSGNEYLRANMNVEWSVSCAEGTTISCPDFGEYKAKVVDVQHNKIQDYLYYADARVLLPAHSKLVLTIPVKVTFTSCIAGNYGQYVGNYIPFRNYASAYKMYFYDENDVPFATNYVDISGESQTGANVVGAVVGEACRKNNLEVKHDVDKNVVVSGETYTGTITIKNTGNYDQVLPYAYLSNHFTQNDRLFNDIIFEGINYGSTTGLLAGSAEVEYSVSCAPETTSGATCPSPAVFNSVFDGSGSAFNEDVLRQENIFLPAGGQLVLTYRATPTLKGCMKNKRFFSVGLSGVGRYYYLNNENAPFNGDNSASALRRVAVMGNMCQDVPVSVQKTADKTVIASGETITYTVTYENNSDVAADVKIGDSLHSFGQNSILPNGVSKKIPSDLHFTYQGEELSGSLGSIPSANVVYSLSCSSETSTGVTCPSSFDGAEKSMPFSHYINYENSYLFGDKTTPEIVTLPPHAKLVVTMPVKITLSECIYDRNWAYFGNAAMVYSSDAASTNIIRAATSVVHSAIVGEQCPPPRETSVKITKTQDADVVLSGQPIVYTLTYENTGDHPTNVSTYRERIDYEAYRSGLSVYNWHGVALDPNRHFGPYAQASLTSVEGWCAPETSEGIACPTVSRQGADGFTVSMVELPPHSKLVLKIRAIITLADLPTDFKFTFACNEVEVRRGWPLDPPYADSWVNSKTKAESCGIIIANDLVVRTLVSGDGGSTWGGELAAGDQALLRVAMSNSRSYSPPAPFAVNLPAGGVMTPSEHSEAVTYGIVPSGSQPFTYTCRSKAKDGTISTVACPSDIAYDAATHSITGTWPTPISADEEAFIDVSFFVGLQPNDVLRSYLVGSDVTGVPGDVNYASNKAEDTFWVRNLGAIDPPLLLPVTGGAAADMFLALGGLTLGGALLTVWWMRAREQRKANALARANRPTLV